MKLLLSLAVLVIAVAGCSSSRQTISTTPPRNYVESMDQLSSMIGLVDKHLIGAQYSLAEQETEQVIKLAGSLGKFDPLRIGDDADGFTEFLDQCEDLRRSGDRLLFLIQQRRREDAKDTLGFVAARYNRLSRSFGPGNEVSLFERPAEKLRGLEKIHSELPGELQPSR